MGDILKEAKKGKAYKSTRRNVKLRKREKREGRKSGSLGDYDMQEIRRYRYGKSKGRVVKPKGGFTGSLKGVKNDTDFYKRQTEIVNMLYGKGASDLRVSQEVANLFDSYQAKKAKAAAKTQRERNPLHHLGKKLDDALFDSNPVGRALEKELKHDSWGSSGRKFQDFSEIKKYKKTPLHKYATKPIGEALSGGIPWVIDKLERGWAGASNAYMEQLKEDTGSKKGVGNIQQELSFIKSLNNWEDFKAGFKKDTDRVTTGFDIIDYIKPGASNAEKSGYGLVYDLLYDPLNFVGVGIGRGAVKALSSDSKQLKQFRAAAIADNKRASHYLTKTQMAPAQFKGTSVYRRMRELKLDKHKVITKEDWEKVLNVPVGKKYASGAEKSMAAKSEVKFYKDLQKVLTKVALPPSKEQALVKQFIDTRAGNYIPKLHPNVENFLAVGKQYDKNSHIGRATSAVQKMVDEFPGLSEKITYVKVDNNLDELAHVNRKGDNLILAINPEEIEKSLQFIKSVPDITKVKFHDWSIDELADVHKGNLQNFYDAVLTHEMGHVFHHRVIEKQTGKATVDNNAIHFDKDVRDNLPDYVSPYARHDYELIPGTGLMAGSVSEKMAEWFAAKVYKPAGISISPSKYDKIFGDVLSEHLRGNPLEKTFRGLKDSLRKDVKNDLRPIEMKIGRNNLHLTPEQIASKQGISVKEATDLKRQRAAIQKQYYADKDRLDDMAKQSKAVIKDLTDNLKIDNILETISKSDQNIRLGISLRLAGKNILTVRGSGKIADKIAGLPMVGDSLDAWRKMFESYETYSKRVGEPDLFRARNKHLTATSRVFQRYSADYHKLFDGVNEATRKQEFSSLKNKLKNKEALTVREQKIYNLFNDLLPEFTGKTSINGSKLTLTEIEGYLPDQFAIKKNAKIQSVQDLMRALGSDVPETLTKVTNDLDELVNAVKWNRTGHLNKLIREAEEDLNIGVMGTTKELTKRVEHLKELQKTVKETDVKARIKTLKEQKARLNKAVKGGVYDDPLQAVWAARIAVEQAKGWKGLVEDVGTTFGIKRKSKDLPNEGKDIKKLMDDHGWRTVKGIDGYIFMPDVAEKVDTLIKLFDRQNINSTLEFFDKVTRAWKVGATLYNPGYYTRNLIGEVVAGYFGGVKNPLYYERSGQVLNFIRKSSEIDELLRSRTPYSDLLNIAKPDGSKVVATTKSGEKITEKMAVAMFHEENLITNFVNTEFHEIGSHIGGVSKLGKPFVKGHNQLRALGEVGENFPRMAHFLHSLEHAPRNFSARQAGEWAASEVRKYHFDYSDVTQFEKAVMMRLIPFYKWTRKAMPMVVESLLAHPNRFMAYPKIMTAWSNAEGNHDQMNGFVPDYPDDIPDFYKIMLAYPVGRDITGKQTYFNVNTPGFDALKSLFDLRSAGELMLNPLIKTPFEQLHGQRLNRNINEMDPDGLDTSNYLFNKERAVSITDQLPATKQFMDMYFPTGDDSNISEPGALMDEDLFNYITGLTALEHNPRGKFDADKNIENALTWGPYGAILDKITKAKDAGEDVPEEVWREQRKFQYENADLFPHLKAIRKTINPDGTYVGGDRYGNLFNYHNKWRTPFGKYLREDGSVDWNAINRDRANGSLEQDNSETG